MIGSDYGEQMIFTPGQRREYSTEEKLHRGKRFFGPLKLLAATCSRELRTREEEQVTKDSERLIEDLIARSHLIAFAAYNRLGRMRKLDKKKS